jgi:hypothetical protein
LAIRFHPPGWQSVGELTGVSKTWARLDETYKLVRRARSGRLAKIIALHESGNGTKYTYPEKGEYFKLSFDYWTADEAWYFSLSFPAKAVLLIVSSLKPPFVLPAEKASRWYGLSPDSLERGLHELRAAGLLKAKAATVESWLSPTGKTTRYDYWLQPPFAQSWSRQRVKRAPGHLRAVGE